MSKNSDKTKLQNLSDSEDEFEKMKIKKIQTTKKPILKLVNEDGNAYNILARARRVALDNDMDWEKIKREATTGNYNDLLCVMMKYFDVE